MADIEILSPDCDDGDDDCKRGKRGKRGHRGHRGHRGPEGPPGPAGTASGGLLKFSGTVAPAVEGGLVVSFLEDYGAGVASFQGVTPVSLAPSYPIAVARNLRNMATNLLLGFVVPDGGQIVIELLQNGVSVPGFVITYTGGETGIKSVLAGPAAFAIGDTFDLRVSVTGGVVDTVDLSATVGVE